MLKQPILPLQNKGFPQNVSETDEVNINIKFNFLVSQGLR